MSKSSLRVILSEPRGFCAGVERAIDIVERALDIYGPPVYVRHEIVHNKRVVDKLKAKGVRFVEEVDEVPEGAIAIFSAHGVAQEGEAAASTRRLQTIDATCPLVSKVHKEGGRYAAKGYDVVLIGHKGHPEVVGTMGQIDGVVHLVSDINDVAALAPVNPMKLAYITQTTLSVDDTRGIIEALTRRFPDIVGPDVKDICYATQNRQTATRALASEVDVILVVGAKNSSNSNRLREIGESEGVASYLIPDSKELRLEWLEGAEAVGITAGASAPEELVQEVIAKLSETFDIKVDVLRGTEEKVQFKLPPELAMPVAAAS